MKKIIILTFLILLITGCSDKTSQVEENKTKSNKIVEEEKKDTYVDTNPIKLGLYIDKKITKEYQTSWVRLQDICIIETYFTQDNEITGQTQKDSWNYYYNNYQNIDNYKIGYNISFTAEGKKFNKTILTPNDIDDFFYYVQLYLYDDINQPNNTYYSHLTNDTYNDNTIISSIKITGGSGIELVESDITITAFTYSYDDFDENNNYLGNSKYTIIIKKR